MRAAVGSGGGNVGGSGLRAALGSGGGNVGGSGFRAAVGSGGGNAGGSGFRAAVGTGGGTRGGSGFRSGGRLLAKGPRGGVPNRLTGFASHAPDYEKAWTRLAGHGQITQNSAVSWRVARVKRQQTYDACFAAESNIEHVLQTYNRAMGRSHTITTLHAAPIARPHCSSHNAPPRNDREVEHPRDRMQHNCG